MNQILQLNPRPLGEHQIILRFPVIRLANGVVEFDVNVEDVPSLIEVLQKSYDKAKEPQILTKDKTVIT